LDNDGQELENVRSDRVISDTTSLPELVSGLGLSDSAKTLVYLLMSAPHGFVYSGPQYIASEILARRVLAVN
jgi:hypothetical protein